MKAKLSRRMRRKFGMKILGFHIVWIKSNKCSSSTLGGNEAIKDEEEFSVKKSEGVDIGGIVADHVQVGINLGIFFLRMHQFQKCNFHKYTARFWTCNPSLEGFDKGGPLFYKRVTDQEPFLLFLTANQQLIWIPVGSRECVRNLDLRVQSVL